MPKRLIKKYPIIDYTAITFGAALMAIGIGVFLIDAKVVPGGVSGLAMAIHYLTGGSIPVGTTIWLMNIPLFLWGMKELGRQFGLRTFVGFSFSSFFIDFFRGDIPGFHYIRLQDSATLRDLFKNDFLFVILIGADLIGVGLGIIFKFKGTTAGSDIIAAIFQKRFGMKPGQSIMIIDFCVIALAGFIIDVKNLSPEKPALSLTLYAFFLLFVSSWLIDVIIEGFDYARAVQIISDKHSEISRSIMEELGRGVTEVHTRGAYSKAERDMLYIVVSLKEISRLVEIIKDIDPHAFVIVNNVHEVLGEGFRKRI